MDEIAYTPTTGVSAVCETPLILASDDNLAGYGWLWPPCRPHPVAADSTKDETHRHPVWGLSLAKAGFCGHRP